MVTRRGFVKSGALAVVGMTVGGIPAFVARAASGIKLERSFKKNKILICIFQRGAMDGLMAVTPFNDSFLQDARPGLIMSAAKSANAPLIDLDGRFGLHPAFRTFEQLYLNKQLAILHGVGSPNNSRSHFDAQDFMESGTPFNKSTESGWLNRVAGLMEHKASPFRAVSLTTSRPRSLYGYSPSISINNLQDFALQMRGNPMAANVTAKSLEDLYDLESTELIRETGKETFDAVKMLDKIDVKNYQPVTGANYPRTSLGNSLRQIAQLIKLDVGLEIGFAETSGWDTHYNQGKENGSFAKKASDLSDSMSAFWTDMKDYQDDLLVMTMTEFGRTVKQNGSGGTDHGRASCSFILGNDINGGKVHGVVPSLTIENLEDQRDLPVTTDFRALFHEVAGKHLRLKDSSSLFPGWTPVKIGVMK